jgi:hypothetical protein
MQFEIDLTCIATCCLLTAIAAGCCISLPVAGHSAVSQPVAGHCCHLTACSCLFPAIAAILLPVAACFRPSSPFYCRQFAIALPESLLISSPDLFDYTPCLILLQHQLRLM